RLHDHLADDLVDRRPDPAAVHGRRRRPAFPRVRDYARDRDPDFGGRVADADADDVRTLPAPHGERATEPVLPEERRDLRSGDRALRRYAQLDAGTAGLHPAPGEHPADP